MLIPYEGISKPVFEYKFKELFESKATYTELPSRNVSQKRTLENTEAHA